MKLKKTGNKLPWLIKQPAQPRHGTDTVFYNSAAWRRLSAAVRIDEPLCPVCIVNGKHSPTKVADHIIPIKFGGSRFSLYNLLALCSECHNYKSGREQRQPLLPYVGAFGEYVPGVEREEVIATLLNKI